MTTENNSLALLPNAQEFSMFQTIARAAQTSGLYAGVGQEAKIFMVLLAARELGISPMLALNGGIWNIQGKIEISARLMNGLIRRAGHSIKIVKSTDTECVLLGTRTDGDSFECSFTQEDATKAGLWGSNVWKKYPGDMLYNRCMSRLARRLFPDVIGNSYVEGEIRETLAPEKMAASDYEDLTPQESREGPAPQISPTPPPPPPPPEPTPKISPAQVQELESMMSQTDNEFKMNFTAYMLKNWLATKFEELSVNYYEIAKTGMQRNIDKNSTAKAVA